MMRSFLRRLAPALCVGLLALTLSFPARAGHEPVHVQLNGRAVEGDVAPFIVSGTAYVPLGTFAAALGDYTARWDGEQARVTGDGLTLTAAPGRLWLEANGRLLYARDGIQLVRGRTMVPVRVAARVFGLEVGWDGASGTVSVTGQPVPLEHGSTYYDPDTLYWLSRVISAESQGEPLVGQLAVGNVVLNRLASPDFPDDLYSVIFQKDQFEPVENGTIHLEPYHLSVTAAKLCLDGAQVIGPCLYFFAPALSPGTWIVNNRTYHTSIGCHDFYL